MSFCGDHKLTSSSLQALRDSLSPGGWMVAVNVRSIWTLAPIVQNFHLGHYSDPEWDPALRDACRRDPVRILNLLTGRSIQEVLFHRYSCTGLQTGTDPAKYMYWQLYLGTMVHLSPGRDCKVQLYSSSIWVAVHRGMHKFRSTHVSWVHSCLSYS